MRRQQMVDPELVMVGVEWTSEKVVMVAEAAAVAAAEVLKAAAKEAAAEAAREAAVD